MGAFTDESMRLVTRNLKRAAKGVLDNLADGLEELQTEAVNHAKENHWARRETRQGKVWIEPSEGGANRQWNLTMRFPRYGDNDELLTGSIGPEDLQIRGGIMLARIAASMPYAANVEFGTKTAMPHPFMRPALRFARDYDQREKVLEKAIAKGLRKGKDRG